MATISMIKALSEYFNTGAGKRPISAWGAELKALTPAEKRELAELVVAQTGDTLMIAKAK